ITLLPMLEAAKADRPLPATASGAYLEGCRRLCAEHRDNQSSSRAYDPGPVTLLAAATRVAAMLQLGRTDALATVPVPAADLSALTLALLEGGAEPADQGDVGCTAYTLAKSTESALFTPLGPGRIGFAHHSFQEFLAAR